MKGVAVAKVRLRSTFVNLVVAIEDMLVKCKRSCCKLLGWKNFDVARR